MKKLISHLTTPTAKNSSIFFFGSLIINFGRYLFHLLLLRFLTPDSYGEFLSLVSLIYILTIPSGVIQTIVNRNVSIYFGKNDKKGINNFFYYLTTRTLLPATLLAISVVLLANPLATILKANPTAFIVLGIVTIFSLLGAVVRSYLPALQQFIAQVVIGFVELLTLITSAYVFLKLDFDALSGILAMLFSSILGISITLYHLRSYILPRIRKIKKPKLQKILLHSFIFSAGTLSLMSTDVLLVRYFFSTHDSGLYSALSIIGRMIFFGLTPLAGLALPIAASRHASQQSTTSTYLKLILAAIFLGTGAVAIFSLFPQFVVSLLSGSEYLAITPLVPYISISMLFLGLNHLTLSYFLAIEKETATYLLLLFTILQPILISLYHTSIYQITTLNLTLQICLFISLLIYNNSYEAKKI